MSEQLLVAIEAVIEPPATRPGLRLSVADFPEEVMALLTHPARCMLPGERAVRVVVFGKSAARNWALPWHRDHVITVANKVEIDGYSNWTRREGILHVRPPHGLLERMIFLRVLLDDTTEESGDLQIAIGCHPGPSAADDPEGVGARVVQKTYGNREDVLVVKALMLPRSGAAARIGPRRAIRIDFCADTLPETLKWAN